MLIPLRDYICHHQVVSTQQLTREFQIAREALQPMLDVWLKKGVIRLCQERSACQQRCFKCQLLPNHYYQYNCV